VFWLLVNEQITGELQTYCKETGCLSWRKVWVQVGRLRNRVSIFRSNARGFCFTEIISIGTEALMVTNFPCTGAIFLGEEWPKFVAYHYFHLVPVLRMCGAIPHPSHTDF
jgi:hypothetical protein